MRRLALLWCLLFAAAAALGVVPWLDAMFGYKNLKANTLVRRAESPLKKKDELHCSPSSQTRRRRTRIS